MLRRLARPLVLVGVRGRRYASNVFGHRTVKAFEVIDFSSNELANRNRNSSLLRLIEAYRVSLSGSEWRGSLPLSRREIYKWGSNITHVRSCADPLYRFFARCMDTVRLG